MTMFMAAKYGSGNDNFSIELYSLTKVYSGLVYDVKFNTIGVGGARVGKVFENLMYLCT